MLTSTLEELNRGTKKEEIGRQMTEITSDNERKSVNGSSSRRRRRKQYKPVRFIIEEQQTIRREDYEGDQITQKYFLQQNKRTLSNHNPIFTDVCEVIKQKEGESPKQRSRKHQTPPTQQGHVPVKKRGRPRKVVSPDENNIKTTNVNDRVGEIVPKYDGGGDVPNVKDEAFTSPRFPPHKRRGRPVKNLSENSILSGCNRKCPVCDLAFTHPAKMKRHFRTKHSADKPYSCPICQREFKRSDDLKRHVITHSGAQPFTCERCDTKFTRLEALKRHQTRSCSGDSATKRTQSIPRNVVFDPMIGEESAEDESVDAGQLLFQCPTCKLKFSSPGTMYRHIQSRHEIDRPYECRICGKRFKRKDDRRRHEKTHSGERPYQCDRCKTRFTRLEALRNHHKSSCKGDVDESRTIRNESETIPSAESSRQHDNDDVSKRIQFLQQQVENFPASCS